MHLCNQAKIISGCGPYNWEAMEHTKKWHPVRDATTYVTMRMVLLFQRETNAFHCFTNGGVIDVVTHYCGDATLQINRD